jgi:DnaK suppressor protein
MSEPERRKYFRKVLTQMIEQLAKNGFAGPDCAWHANERFPDPIDWAIADRDREMSLRILKREKELIGSVESALERVDAGSYGICEGCEEEIALARLKARPITTLCIACQKKEENEARRARHTVFA